MKLFRFRYSPSARKAQMLLDLLGAKYELVEVSYSDRRELATLTGGYIYVPVLLDDDGSVVVESRAICERLLSRDATRRLAPPPWAGPIWAYADFCDGPLEDILFRIASPGVQAAWPDAGERALYRLIKERKFGAGCIESWQRQQPELLARAQTLLSPTLETLEARPFLFGDTPTLADAALYGNLAMLHEASPELVSKLAPTLEAYRARVEQAAAARG